MGEATGGTDQKAGAPGSSRSQDPEGVRRNILEVATREFAAKGYSGARVDEIAERTATSKRMIYYYFGDKEGLFVAVLEDAYARIRAIEQTLALDGLPAVEALRRIAEFTFDYQNENRDFVRLVMVENIHNAAHLERSRRIESLNVPAITALRAVYDRGVAEGVFRPGLDVVDLHMTVSALCFFNVSNRPTFSRIFKLDMDAPAALAHRRAVVAETVVRYAVRNLSEGETQTGV